jgi:hypothetical protein
MGIGPLLPRKKKDLITIDRTDDQGLATIKALGKASFILYLKGLWDIECRRCTDPINVFPPYEFRYATFGPSSRLSAGSDAQAGSSERSRNFRPKGMGCRVLQSDEEKAYHKQPQKVVYISLKESPNYLTL